MSLNESIVEEAALEWFLLRPPLRQGIGWQARLLRTGRESAFVMARIDRAELCGRAGAGESWGHPFSPKLRQAGRFRMLNHECPRNVSVMVTSLAS